MPHGRRTDRINERDLEALHFVARFGTVPRSVLRARFSSGRTATFERIRRLRQAGLIDVRRGPDEHDGILIATRRGLRACGHGELGLARLSPATVGHEIAVALFAARRESGVGELLLSEREILAREREEGAPVFSAALPGGRTHRADLLRPGHEEAEAIEVELSVKGAKRLDAILRAWRFAVAEGRLSRVVYHCAPRVLPYLEKGLARTATATMIEAVELDL